MFLSTYLSWVNQLYMCYPLYIAPQSEKLAKMPIKPARINKQTFSSRYVSFAL